MKLKERKRIVSLDVRTHNIPREILLIVVVVLIVLSLLSCGSNKIEGVVVGKHYEPSYTYTTVVPVIVNGHTTMIPQTRYKPAQYVLTLSCTKNNETDVIITVSVSPEEYYEIEIGDYYTNYKEE